MIDMAVPENTRRSNSCIAMFSCCSEVLTALKKIARAGFPEETIAFVELFAGLEETLSTLLFASTPQPNVKMQCTGNEVMFISGFLVPDFSRVTHKEPGIECRKIIPLILSDIGIPAANQSNYSSALEHGQAIVIVRGAGEQVERAAELLATGEEIEVAVYEGAYT